MPLAAPPRAEAAGAALLARLARLRSAPPRLLALLRITGFVVAVGLVALVALRAASGARLDRLAVLPFVGAVAAGTASWLAMGRGWASLSAAAVPSRALATWARTQVLRYLPGALWAPAARAPSVAGRRRDKLATVIAENVVLLGVAVPIAGVWLTAAGDPRWAPLVVVAGVPPLLARLLAGRTALTPRRVVAAAWWCAVSFAFFGASAALAQDAVGAAPDPLRIAGTACLAWAFGLVVVFAPGGVGAREVAYVTLLAGLLPDGQLALGALTARLAAFAGELVVLVVAGRPRRASAGRDGSGQPTVSDAA